MYAGKFVWQCNVKIISYKHKTGSVKFIDFFYCNLRVVRIGTLCNLALAIFQSNVVLAATTPNISVESITYNFRLF